MQLTSLFGGVDPLASEFPSYTPYHYVHNNPINIIDPTGMSADTAWVPTREWNSGDADRYSAFVDGELEDMIEEGEVQDCADVAVKLLVRFASREGLEIELTAADGETLNSTTDDSSSPEQFEQKARDRVNARSIDNDMSDPGTGSVRSGDMTNTQTHVQVASFPNGKGGPEGFIPVVSSTNPPSVLRPNYNSKSAGFKRFNVIINSSNNF